MTSVIEPTGGVTLRSSPALRQAIAAVLMLALTLAGVGRGWAAASDDARASVDIPGVAFHICHSGAETGSRHDDASRHHCCDACALSAPATLPQAPSLTGPASVALYVEHSRAMAWTPTVARLRTPRQSQGPPTA